MPDVFTLFLREAVLSEDESMQRDVLFIKFHIRDLIDDRPDGHLINDNGVGAEGAEEFSTQGAPKVIGSLSIPRQLISDKRNLLPYILYMLNRFDVPSSTVMECAEQIYWKAVSLESESCETIRPILVNITFVTFTFVDELIRRVGDLFVSVPASKSSIEALEKVEGSGLEEECAICLQDSSSDSKVARMLCSHLFHEKCIVKWLEKSHSCPMCRFEMPLDPNLSLC